MKSKIAILMDQYFELPYQLIGGPKIMEEDYLIIYQGMLQEIFRQAFLEYWMRSLIRNWSVPRITILVTVCGQK